MWVFRVQQPCPTTLVSVAGFHSPGDKGVLYKFINEFFSQLMNVYTRRAGFGRKAEVLTSQQK